MDYLNFCFIFKLNLCNQHWTVSLPFNKLKQIVPYALKMLDNTSVLKCVYTSNSLIFFAAERPRITIPLRLKAVYILTILIFIMLLGFSCDLGAGADIIFVIGASDASDFEKIKHFVRDVVSNFDIGPNKTRIGLISFG